MLEFGEIREFIRLIVDEWREDEVSRLSISIAYFTIFSIPPMIIILLLLVGTLFNGVELRSVERLALFIGADAAAALGEIIEDVNQFEARRNIFATLLGIGTLLFGASAVFRELRRALNVIWGVTPRPEVPFFRRVFQQFLSFGMVFAFGFLLVVSFIVSTVLQAILDRLPADAVEFVLLTSLIQQGVSLLVFSMVFTVLLKLTPDVIVRWRDVLVGGVVTAILFVTGQSVISFYFGRGNLESTYGAAGWIIVLLLWALFASNIFLLGAEITQIYAKRYGGYVAPNRLAEWVDEQDTQV